MLHRFTDRGRSPRGRGDAAEGPTIVLRETAIGVPAMTARDNEQPRHWRTVCWKDGIVQLRACTAREEVAATIAARAEAEVHAIVAGLSKGEPRQDSVRAMQSQLQRLQAAHVRCSRHLHVWSSLTMSASWTAPLLRGA